MPSNRPETTPDEEEKKPDFTVIHRTPILLTNHTVMLIQLYHAYDYVADSWTWDIIDARSEQEAAARQLIAQLGEHWTVAFLQALQRAIVSKLRENDQQYGTAFAEEDSRVQT